MKNGTCDHPVLCSTKAVAIQRETLYQNLVMRRLFHESLRLRKTATCMECRIHWKIFGIYAASGEAQCYILHKITGALC